MSLLSMWWRQIRGYVSPDPWEHDPQIKSERVNQHDRIDKVQRYVLDQERRARRQRAIEEAWRREHG